MQYKKHFSKFYENPEEYFNFWQRELERRLKLKTLSASSKETSYGIAR